MKYPSQQAVRATDREEGGSGWPSPRGSVPSPRGFAPSPRGSVALLRGSVPSLRGSVPSSRGRCATGLRVDLLVAAAALLAACSAPTIERPDPYRAGGRGGAGGSGTAGAGGGLVLPDGGGTDGAGGSPGACAGDTFRAETTPLDLLLLVDTSRSMEEAAGGGSKWSMVRQALETFVADPRSAGLGVGLGFFPSFAPAKACTSDAQCGQGPSPIPLCANRRACAAPGGSPRGLPCIPLIAAFCPTGTSCVAVGRCSVSGGECTVSGLPCPGGAADVCDTNVRTCQPLSDSSCLPAQYKTPRVPIAGIAHVAPAIGEALAGVSPEGDIPLAPATRGAHDYLRAHLAANAGRRAILVLATSGLPVGCQASAQSVAMIAETFSAARSGTPPVSTYIVAGFQRDLFNDDRAAFERLAEAGGTAPFIVGPNQHLGQAFLAALDEIRRLARACELQLPRLQSGTLDYGKVNLQLSMPAAAPETLVYVGEPDRCTARGGWHYNIAPTAGVPTHIVTCPATCQHLRTEPTSAVEIKVGCVTQSTK